MIKENSKSISKIKGQFDKLKTYVKNLYINLKYFNDLNIGTKLSYGFITVIILFLIPVIISLKNFNDTANLFVSTNEITIPEIYHATSISTDIKHIEKNLYALLLTDNISKKEDLSSINNELYEEIENHLIELKNLLSTDKDKIDYLIEVLNVEKKVRNEIINSKYKSDAQRIIFNSYEPIVNDINNNLDYIKNGINERINERAESSDRNSKFSIILTIVMTVIVSFFAVVISYVISNSIIKPLNEIEKLAAALSVGDLNYKINYKSENELGILSKTMESSIGTIVSYIKGIDEIMSEVSKGNLNVNLKQKFSGEFERIEKSITQSVHMLSSTLHKINESTKEVSMGAEQIAMGAQSLSVGSTEQSSSVEELSATIEEISQMIKLNANMAEEASSSALQVKNEINFSNEQMKNMIFAMEIINVKSKNIGKIINTIEDIAFQTNILALNAAVEAAHAGSAGKGFSVVADEVRNLAVKSSEAAKNTTTLVQETVKSINEGNKTLELTAHSLNNVVIGSENINNMIYEVSRNSQEQSSSIEQIMCGIEQISIVVQKNSALAEEDAATSEELSGQAQELHSLVNKFVFKEQSI